MWVAVELREATDESLAFVKQLGVEHVAVYPDRMLVGGRTIYEPGYLDYLPLLQLKKRIESFGLTVDALTIPGSIYENVLLGTPERERDMEGVCKSIRNMGRVGIPIMAYNFRIVGVWGHWRSYGSGGGRGGAGIKSFDYELVKDAPLSEAGSVSAEEKWSRIAYFLERAVPAAEEAGVKLACHPDDPPGPTLRGEARVLGSFEGLKRFIELAPSPASGFNFCQGTVQEMMGVKVLEAIRYFGSRGKIFYVHFRNIKGVWPKFDEVFIDDGDLDMFEALRAYREVGFQGPLIPDHTPKVVGDDPGGRRGRAFAIGYIKGLLHGLEYFSR